MEKSLRSLLALLLVLLLGVSAWALPPLSQEALKDQVTRLAYDNMTNRDNRTEIRAQMDQLIAQLKSVSPPVNEETWKKFAPGSWQQIWSDERDMSPPGSPAQDLAQIYQYVSAEGWGFNYGERIIPGRGSVTFALAVVGSVQNNEQTTEITRAFFRDGALKPNEDLVSLSDMIQAGDFKGADFMEREAGRFPRGPIGAKGVLTIEFLDADLKLGYTKNVYTGDLELFVMKRVPGVVKD